MAGLEAWKEAKMFQWEWEEGNRLYVYKPTEYIAELNTEIKKR